MRRTQAAVLSLALLLALGCDDRDSPISPAADPADPVPNQSELEMAAAETADAEATAGMGGLIFGVDADNTLIAFSRRNPGSLTGGSRSRAPTARSWGWTSGPTI